MAKITINDLLEAGCHYGHQTRRWNPRMKEYVYTVKYVFDEGSIMPTIASRINLMAEGKNVFVIAMIVYAVVLVL